MSVAEFKDDPSLDAFEGMAEHAKSGKAYKLRLLCGITFETVVDEFNHEAMSMKLVDLLFDKYVSAEKFELEPDDLLFVKECIDGGGPGKRNGRERSKWYLYNIVANKPFGLDTDRLIAEIACPRAGLSAGAREFCALPVAGRRGLRAGEPRARTSRKLRGQAPAGSERQREPHGHPKGSPLH